MAESGGDIDSISFRVDDLKEKLEQLKSQEDELDHHCKIMMENLKQTQNDPTNQYYAYVTRDDFVDVFGSEDVVLTIRNYDSCDNNSPPDDASRQTLRFLGKWKSIDVRLVTDDGESMRPSINFETELAENEQMKSNAAVGVSSSSQPTANRFEALGNISKRRPKRRKRHIIKEDDDEDNDDSTMSSAFEGGSVDREFNGRLVTAQALLGFRPSRKHLKRNLDHEVSDSFECR